MDLADFLRLWFLPQPDVNVCISHSFAGALPSTSTPAEKRVVKI